MELVMEIEGVTKLYDERAVPFLALDDVTLRIRPGEIVLLIGPSGSGKTTLLSIMGCILRPSSGSVKIRGRETVGLGERSLPAFRLRHIGFIFQGFNLFPTLTAGENVEMTLDLKGIRGGAARKASKASLERVGLLEKYDSFPSSLSGGQKQRVAIARALAGEPDVILADEPTAALDWNSGKVVMDILHRLSREEGRSSVIVSHDNRTLEYADRIVRIEDGRIVSEEQHGGGNGR